VEFIYQRYLGEFKKHSLEKWDESGAYVRGICSETGVFKTYRKDRISEYLHGSETLLVEPHVKGPQPLPRRPLEESADGRRARIPAGVPTILFTGFVTQQRSEFEASAAQAGLFVCQSVIKGLNFLCTGSNAGPAKIEKSRQQGTYIIPQRHFHAFIESGILPDED
jgi:NAD-dependent DNA ligase